MGARNIPRLWTRHVPELDSQKKQDSHIPTHLSDAFNADQGYCTPTSSDPGRPTRTASSNAFAVKTPPDTLPVTLESAV